MTDQPSTSALENRLRAAKRQGYRLEKSRVCEPRAISYGTYHLADVATNTLECYGLGSGYGLSLTEVAEALFGERP
jgi:hypothetical protein